MPATMDFDNDILDDEDLQNPFEFYESYSICKLPVIYTVAKSRPEAAAFAPCTLMVYKKKNEDKIVFGFPAVYNWLSSAKVEDKEAKATLLKAEKDFESILRDITEWKNYLLALLLLAFAPREFPLGLFLAPRFPPIFIGSAPEFLTFHLI